MSRLTLTLITLSLALAVAGCDKPQLNAVSDEQQQNLPDSPTATDIKSIADESQIADDTPVDPANRKPFQFTITTEDTNSTDNSVVRPISPVVIQFGENAVDLTENGDKKGIKILKAVKMVVVIHPNKSKNDAQIEIDCESDGTYEFMGNTIDYECSYTQDSGTHQISIHGDISAIELCAGRVDFICNGPRMSDDLIEECRINVLSRLNPIISVDSWGDIQWESMQGFAQNCVLLKKIPEDAPDLSHANNMSGMFNSAVQFNQAIDHWDVSNVTDMSYMFANAHTFNQPLEKWNVSNVTDMSGMFRDTKAFNQPLEKWNVSNVTNMSWMFNGTMSFNQPLEKWNVSNVTNMSRMFKGTMSFNQPLDQWDLSSVNDMTEMFRFALSFNHYPSSWVVPKDKTDFMFSGSPLEEQAKQKPLKTRKVKK